MFASVFGRVKPVVWLRCVLCLWLVASFGSAARAGSWDVSMAITGTHNTAGMHGTGSFPTISTKTASFSSETSTNRADISGWNFNASFGTPDIGGVPQSTTIFSDVDSTAKVTMVWRRGSRDPANLQPPSDVKVKLGTKVRIAAYGVSGTRTFGNLDNGFPDDKRYSVDPNDPNIGQYYKDRRSINSELGGGPPIQYHVLVYPVQNGRVEFSFPLKGGAQLTFVGDYTRQPGYGQVGMESELRFTLDNRLPLITAMPDGYYGVRYDNGRGDIIYNAYAKIGLYNDGIPENPIVRFFQGDSTFAFDGLKNGQTIALRNHKWSVSPQIFLPRELENAAPQTRAESEVTPPTRNKRFHWNLGPVEGADPASFPKSTFVNVSAIDPSDGAMLHGTAKVNWHLTPAMRFRLEGSIEPILPPDHDPGDEPGAAEWEQIEMIKETRRQLADAGIQVISVVMEGTMLVVDVMMPDVTDVTLGVVKAARAVRLVGKLQDILSTVKANRLAQWQAKRAARGKVGPVALKSTTEVINKGRVGTKRPNAIYPEADEAAGTREVAVKIAKQGMCFVAGTPILMGDNTLKAIEQIKVGDLVVSRENKTNVTTTKRVTDTIKRQAPATLVLTFANNEKIETTEEHPFYVEGKGFVKAGELGIGTSIVTRSGPSLRVLDVEKKTTPTFVYNFTVEDFHTYFVGKNKLWVHNGDCDADELAQHAWVHVVAGQFNGIPEAPILTEVAFSSLISYIMRNRPMHSLPRGRYGWFDESRGIIVIHDISPNAPNPGTVVRPGDPYGYWDDLINDRL